MPITPISANAVTRDITNKNGVSDRRGASGKQNNSVLKSEWPVLTKSAYEALVRGGKDVPHQPGKPVVPPNLRLKRLAYARSMLGQAKLAMDGCLHDHRPAQAGKTPDEQNGDAKIYNKIRGINERVEKAYLEFPLEIR